MKPSCIACSGDATHSLYWWPKRRRWLIHARARTTPVRYCKWHATVQATQWNARGCGLSILAQELQQEREA